MRALLLSLLLLNPSVQAAVSVRSSVRVPVVPATLGAAGISQPAAGSLSLPSLSQPLSLPAVAPALSPLSAVGAGVQASPAVSAQAISAAAPVRPAAVSPSAAPQSRPAQKTAAPQARQQTQPSAKETLTAVSARASKGLNLAPAFDGSVFAADSTPHPVDASFKTKPLRQDLAGERAAFEYSREIDALYAELTQIHSLEMKGQAAPAARKLKFLSDLEKLHDALPAAAAPAGNWEELKAALAQAQENRAEGYLALRAARQAGKAVDLRSFNQAGIELNSAVLKAQLKTARFLISENSPLKAKALRRNAALWTLAGAYASAVQLRSEIRFAQTLALARQRAREFWTTDASGRWLRVFSLDGFDIEFGEGKTVSIRQQRWRNAHALLAQAGRDLRNGREAQADAALVDVSRLYALPGGVLDAPLSARYAATVSAAAEARKKIAALNGLAGDARKEALAQADAAVAAVAQTIAAPKLAQWREVEYRDLAAALRSQAHTLAGQQDEVAVVLGNAADARFAAELLQASFPSAGRSIVRRMPKKEQQALVDLAEHLAVWAGRGLVREKQEAAADFSAAARHLKAGETGFAADFFLKAAAALDRRGTALSDMSRQIQRRAAALYAEFRAAEVKQRTAEAAAALAQKLTPEESAAVAGDLEALAQTYWENAADAEERIILERAARLAREGRPRLAAQALRELSPA